MEDSLENPLQSEENGIHIDICLENYYPDESGAQNVTLSDGTIITILYYGVLPYIPVLCPTLKKLTPISVLTLHYRTVGTHSY